MSALPYAAEAEQEITIEELEYLEAKYNAEKEERNISVDTQFLYAWGLIRSKYQDDKVLGIALLQETMGRWPSRTRECLYYLAVGHYRLGQYSEAHKSINELLRAEPNNQQALSLQKLIESKVSQEGVIGMALIGGIAAAAAGIIIAALRSRARQE